MGKFGETFLNWEVMAQYAPRIAEGFFVTLQLAALIVVTGLAAGLAAALVRSLRVRLLNFFIVAAVDVLRALPPLVLPASELPLAPALAPPPAPALPPPAPPPCAHDTDARPNTAAAMAALISLSFMLEFL